jgi:hypothetical protein
MAAGALVVVLVTSIIVERGAQLADEYGTKKMADLHYNWFQVPEMGSLMTGAIGALSFNSTIFIIRKTATDETRKNLHSYVGAITMGCCGM